MATVPQVYLGQSHDFLPDISRHNERAPPRRPLLQIDPATDQNPDILRIHHQGAGPVDGNPKR